MYDSNALQMSNDKLASQIEFVKQTRPEIKQIVQVDNEINTKPDYLLGIDAYGININGQTLKIQFKNRKEGNTDFVLLAKKLSGVAANTNNNLGFWYENNKYTFHVNADITIESLGSHNYAVTGDEIGSMEAVFNEYVNAEEYISAIRPKYVYADNGSKIYTGDYYVFMNIEKLGMLKSQIFMLRNPGLFS